MLSNVLSSVRRKFRRSHTTSSAAQRKWSALAFVIVAFCSTPIHAQPIVEKVDSLEVIVARADFVVIGAIVELKPPLDPQKKDYGEREIMMEVEFALKGKPPVRERGLRVRIIEATSTLENWKAKETRLLVAIRVDPPGATAIDLSDPQVLTSDLTVLRTAKDVIRVAEITSRQTPELKKDATFEASLHPLDQVTLDRLKGTKWEKGMGLRLTVPVDIKLETRSIAYLGSNSYLQRLEGMRALRHFKSDENIVRAKELLDDPGWGYLQRAEDNEGVEVRHYGVRKAAYQALKHWGVQVDKPIIREKVRQPDPHVRNANETKPSDAQTTAAALQTKPSTPRLPDRLSKDFLISHKFLIHSFRWADATAKPDPIVFRGDGTVENKRAGLGGETWDLPDEATLRVGKVRFRLDRDQGILRGRVGEALHSDIYLDIPEERTRDAPVFQDFPNPGSDWTSADGGQRDDGQFSWRHYNREHTGDVIACVAWHTPGLSIDANPVRQASLETITSSGYAYAKTRKLGQPIDDTVRHHIASIIVQNHAAAQKHIYRVIEYTYVYEIAVGESRSAMAHGYVIPVGDFTIFVQHTANRVITSDIAQNMAMDLAIAKSRKKTSLPCGWSASISH